MVIIRNNKLYIAAMADETKEDSSDESRTELDSHANMPVVGRNAYILSESGETVSVAPFTPDYKPMRVRVVDAAIQYDCPYDGDAYILVIRNALYVPSMDNNLIPPFMMREAGIKISEVPKIHATNPTVEYHAISFPETGFRIPLSLWGTFSYFPTCKPSHNMLQEPPNVYLLTPTQWNPHSDAYAINEESMLDWEGNMKEKKDWEQRVVLDDIEASVAMVSSMHLSEMEEATIDSVFNLPNDEQVCEETILETERNLYEAMTLRAEHGNFAMNIGATNTKVNDVYLEVEPNDDIASDSDDDAGDDEFDFDDCEPMDLDNDESESLLDSFMASANTAGKPRGVDAKHLSKIWRISYEEAKQTIETTTQTSVRRDDPTLSRNYGTNDRMLRYKRIKEYFFMDTFFATKKGGKSSRGHTCCQLFVTDKGFVYVVPMRRKSEVILAIKQFAKEIGAPDAIVADMSGEQMSDDMRKFCNDIGTTLRALEEGTPWSNKAELYIGLIKEAVRKDMRESNSPMCFWDYCVERRARINNLTAKNVFRLHGTTAHTHTTGEEGDISNLCQYGWYEWCYYREQTAAFPHNKEVLGRVLGPAPRILKRMKTTKNLPEIQWRLKILSTQRERFSTRTQHMID